MNYRMKISHIVGALAVGCLAIGLSTPSQAQPRHTKVGALTCNLAPSIGLIIGSRQRMSCQFRSDGGNFVESYSGTITRVGLDLGFTGGGRMVWGVFSRVAGPK